MNTLSTEGTQLGFPLQAVRRVNPLCCSLLGISTNYSDPRALMAALGPFAKGPVGTVRARPESCELLSRKWLKHLLQLGSMWLQ